MARYLLAGKAVAGVVTGVDREHREDLSRVAIESHSRGTAQTGIAGHARPQMAVPPNTVTGPWSGGRPVNHLGQVTTAHLAGHKPAKAIWASSTGAESK
jgi:hypothetical protein